MFSLLWAVFGSEADLEGKECDRGKVFRERAGAFFNCSGLSAIPRAVLAIKMIASSRPNRDHNRYSAKAMATVKTKMSRGSWPFGIIIGGNGNLHQMSTTHGVSGYPCLGVAGDWQTQERSNPWINAEDPIVSYMNAQNHIGVPLSTFNEPWTGGVLTDENFNAQPYREPLVGSLSAPPVPKMKSVEVAKVDYPSQLGVSFPQQLPNARIHSGVSLPLMDRQNMEWEAGTGNGDNKVFMPQQFVELLPNTSFFQGASTSTGVHPQNDVANQQTTGNTARSDFRGGQAPFQKLPNGMTVGELQPFEPPALWETAPPPDPVVQPGMGTGPLLPTNPAWW